MSTEEWAELYRALMNVSRDVGEFINKLQRQRYEVEEKMPRLSDSISRALELAKELDDWIKYLVERVSKYVRGK